MKNECFARAARAYCALYRVRPLEGKNSVTQFRHCLALCSFFGVAACATAARADYSYCTYNFGPGTTGQPPEFTVCASTTAGAGFTGGDEADLVPDGRGKNAVFAGRLATGDGGLGSAKAGATVGELNADVKGQALVELPEPNDGWLAIGQSTSAFYDRVTIQGLPGVALGTPVTVHVLSHVQGSFSGMTESGGKILYGAQADFDGSVYDSNNVLLPVGLSGFYYAADPERSADVELTTLRTGDSMYVSWRMIAVASADGLRKLTRDSFAVVKANLFINVTSGNARAIGSGGHDFDSDGMGDGTDPNGDAGAPNTGAAGTNSGAAGTNNTGAAGSSNAAVGGTTGAGGGAGGSSPGTGGAPTQATGGSAAGPAPTGSSSSSCAVASGRIGRPAPSSGIGFVCGLLLVCAAGARRRRVGSEQTRSA